MSTITSLDAGDNGSVSRGVINTNFTNLNTDKVEKTGTDPVAITIADGANVVGLTVTQNDVTNNPVAINIVNNGSGKVANFQHDNSSFNGVYITTLCDDASPADLDLIAELDFNGRNDAAQEVSYAGIQAFIIDQTDTTEDGAMRFNIQRAGAYTEMLEVGSELLAQINGVSVGASTAAGVLSSRGNQDLILQTGNTTTGNITITDGANGAINLQPNGTGEAQVNGEQILTEALIKRVYKSADETLNNTITLQDDDHLTFAIGANEVWAFQMSVFYTAHSSADFAYTWSLPSGATLTAGNDDFPSNSLSGGNNYSFGGNTGTKMAAGLYGVVVNGVNAGSVTFRWAQLTLNASDITVHQGSHIIAHRLA